MFLSWFFDTKNSCILLIKHLKLFSVFFYLIKGKLKTQSSIYVNNFKVYRRTLYILKIKFKATLELKTSKNINKIFSQLMFFCGNP